MVEEKNERKGGAPVIHAKEERTDHHFHMHIMATNQF
jgi:hypothetical protein